LIGLRQEILQQDYRGLYLAWLKAIALSEGYIDIDKTQLEPPLPPGLGQLSAAQKAFTEIFELDEHLLNVACASSGKLTTISEQTWQQAITQLSASERQDFLLRLAKGEPNLSAKFKQKLSQLIPTSPPSNQPRRTVQELLEAASEEEKKAEKRRQQEAEAKRIEELQTLAKREAQVWQQVESLIQKAQSKSYYEAVKLLVKLRDLAEYQNGLPVFQECLNQIYEQYSNRSGLKRRLQEIGLTDSK
jgi:citrate synthase